VLVLPLCVVGEVASVVLLVVDELKVVVTEEVDVTVDGETVIELDKTHANNNNNNNSNYFISSSAVVSHVFYPVL